MSSKKSESEFEYEDNNQDTENNQEGKIKKIKKII
jgi:hypothetical protein